MTQERFNQALRDFGCSPQSWLMMLVMLIAGSGMLPAQPPASIPDPWIMDNGDYVYDPGHLLSDDTLEGVDKLIDKARKTTTCEIAVAIVDNLAGLTIEDYSYQLFKHWGVGKDDKDNGILLVVCPKEKTARIEVGSGAEGVFTDIACAKLLRRRMIPLMKEGNINQAVYGTVNDIERTMRSQTFGNELRSANEDTTMRRIRTISPSAFRRFMKYMVICAFLFTLLLFITDLFTTRGKRNYRRAMTWRNHLSTYVWGGVLSLGTALPITLLAWLLYKRARNIPEICDTCGATMEKLSEEEDNKYLSASQDFEEKLGTVDYDVWKCPDCGTIEYFPYVERQLKYQECPKCHTVAMNLGMDKVIEEPTTKHPGRGMKIYTCQFCGNFHREEYDIPRKEDPSAAIAVAAALGAMAAGGRGAGPIGGGDSHSFGGGRSSGGGASSRW
ncbi:MAG: TPM domain-containing protein [Muribaculaceae bacterium]|nr:TPM domain-containing protein [Muribaculaceae bacterium]MDE6558884.1 TPM domain-containing protein [Muribaculaceae bacterium]